MVEETWQPYDHVNVQAGLDAWLSSRAGRGRSLMYELIRNGQIASVHIGRLRRIAPDALSIYVASLHDRGGDHEPAGSVE